MDSEVRVREKDKDLGEVKSMKLKTRWTTVNKKLFLDLTLEEKQKGNRPGKAFNAIGWENINKEFNAKTGTQYEFTEVAKTLISSISITTLSNSIKVAIDILNNNEGIEAASLFWVNATEILENETKGMLWLWMWSRHDFRGRTNK